MSRSHKKTPIFGVAKVKSEALDKKLWHSRYRHNAKQNLNTVTDFENFTDIDHREVSDPWSMAKDGKIYSPRWISVDKAMRK